MTRTNTMWSTGTALVLTFLGLWTAPAAPFEPLFDSWYGFDTGFYPTGRFPYAARVADLDSDGDPDLVVSLWWFPNRVSVLLNESGAFGPPVLYTTQKSSFDLAVGDLNGDTFPDIIVSNTGANWEGTTVSVLFNEGDGTFAPHQVYNAVAGPVGVTAADFDGDGHTDVAVANYGYVGQGNKVALLLNDGTGGLETPVLYNVPMGPYKLAAGDLDGDDLPDLAVGCVNTLVAILVNTGGAFAPPVLYDAGGQFGGDYYPNVKMADVDNDEDLDVLYSSTHTQLDADQGAVAVFRNQGDGTLTGPALVPLPVYLGGASESAAEDVTGDGWVDIMTVHLDSGGWVLVPGDGSGGFLEGAEYPGGEDPIAVGTGDMDGDQDVDVIVVNRNSLEATVHPNLGDGELAVPRTYPVGSLYADMDAADIDGDDDLDVATSFEYAGGGGIAVLRNLGDGAFGPAVNYPGPRGVMQVKFRDLNGDGCPDLLWASGVTSPPYDFHTRMNQGDGTFGPAVTWPVSTCGSGDVEGFDMDNDEDLDVFLTDYLGCAGGGEDHVIYISRNNGNGTFQAAYAYETFTNPEIVRGADLDGDGNRDLIWTESTDVGVALGNGDGSFGPFSLHGVDWGPKDLFVDDVNGDEVPDLMTCNMSGDPQQSMNVLIGRGDGTFEPYDRYVVSDSPDLSGVAGIATGDADLDGDGDVMVLNRGSNDFSFFENRGDGTFEPHVRYGVGAAPTDLAFGDFTGDGTGDVAAIMGYPPSNLPRGMAVVAGRATPADVQAPAVVTDAVRLMPASPNPFSKGTTVHYFLPDTKRVRLGVYDVAGRRVRTLVDGTQETGLHHASWTGADGRGRPAAPGVYLARLEAGGIVRTQRFIIVR